MTSETWQYTLLLDGREVQLGDGEVTLGRSRTSTVRIEHESVSRTHALLTFEQGSVIFKDLNSSNGSFVGGKRVQGETRVNDGDRIQLGAAVVTLKVIAPFRPAEKTAMMDTGLGSGAASAVPVAPAVPQAHIPVHEPVGASVPVAPQMSAVPARPALEEAAPVAHPMEISADEFLRQVEQRVSDDSVPPLGVDTVADERAPEPELLPPPPVPPVAFSRPQPAAPKPPPAPAPAPYRPAPVEFVDSPSLPPKIRIVRPTDAPPDHSLSQVPLRRSDRRRPTETDQERILETAGIGLRLVAFLVDGVILSAMNLLFMTPVALVYFFVGQMSSDSPRPGWILFAVSTLSFLLILAADFWYVVGGWARTGRTPGKSLMGLRIVTSPANGEQGLGLQTALMRWVFMVLGGIPLYAGWIIAAFRADRKAWHDLMASTRVVKTHR